MTVEQPAPAENPIVCAACHLKLEFVGTRDFHEGTRAQPAGVETLAEA